MIRLRATIALGSVLALVLAAAADAETLRPTRFDDPVPNGCQPHNCSLREALIRANDEFNTDKILLQKGTYELEIPAVVGDLGQDNGDLDIGYPVKIRGEGPKHTRIDANGLDRVLYFNEQSQAPAGRSLLRSLTIKGGDATVVPDVQHPANGGGIQLTNPSAKMTLKNVAVRHNEAALGGGIHSQALGLTIVNSTIAQNNAGEGGGLRLPVRLYNQPVTTIRSSTISGNYANKGGGILADGSGASGTLFAPSVALVTSTVANNHASNEAGGVMADNSAFVTLGGSTVAYNIAGEDAPGTNVAGGIYQHSGASFVFADSILAQNTVVSGTDPQCAGSFGSNLGAVVEVQSSPCTMSGSPAVVGSAKTEPLASNGGPTKTVKILKGSPAIGSSVECAKRDQRGVRRPTDGCDAGAYESKAGPD
jgi:hypothetical protein